MAIILKNSTFYRPNQKPIFESTTRFNIAFCGRRFGKTEGAMRQLLTKALNKHFTEFPCHWISPVVRQAKKVFARFREKYKQVIAKTNQTDLTLTLITGRQIYFCGSDHPDSILGDGSFFMVLDEIGVMKPDVWDMVCRPMLSDLAGHGYGSATLIGTPRGRHAWSFELFKKAEEDPQWTSHTFTTVEGGNIDPEEVEHARSSLPPDIFKQEYEAQIISRQGLVYPEYGKHNVIKSVPDWFHPSFVGCGVDFGYEHPTVFTVVAQDYTKQHHICLETIYLRKTEIGGFLKEARRLKERYGINKFYCDHNRPDFIQRMNQEGLLSEPAPKGKDSVMYGIDLVRELLYINAVTGKPRLMFVDDLTREIQKEFDFYLYKEGTDVPDKNMGKDDGLDSLRYNITSMVGKIRGRFKDV